MRIHALTFILLVMDVNAVNLWNEYNSVYRKQKGIYGLPSPCTPFKGGIDTFSDKNIKFFGRLIKSKIEFPRPANLFPSSEGCRGGSSGFAITSTSPCSHFKGGIDKFSDKNIKFFGRLIKSKIEFPRPANLFPSSEGCRGGSSGFAIPSTSPCSHFKGGIDKFSDKNIKFFGRLIKSKIEFPRPANLFPSSEGCRGGSSGFAIPSTSHCSHFKGGIHPFNEDDNKHFGSQIKSKIEFPRPANLFPSSEGCRGGSSGFAIPSTSPCSHFKGGIHPFNEEDNKHFGSQIKSKIEFPRYPNLFPSSKSLPQKVQESFLKAGINPLNEQDISLVDRLTSNKVKFYRLTNLFPSLESLSRAFDERPRGDSATRIITDSTNYYKRQNLCYAVGFGGTAIVHAGLYQLWYKDYPSSKFHFFNDNYEWLQMDKFGHVFSSYYLGMVGIEAAKWAGISENKQWKWALFGSIFQNPIEIWDGFSSGWGASAGDLLANTLGTVLSAGQHALWKEQKIIMKLSFTPSSFAKLRPNVLGSNLPENVLKDYNGQTYWLCYSPLKRKNWEWLGLCMGYGANGMIGGEDNLWKDQLNVIHDDSKIKRYRQYYLGLDYNLTRIKTNIKAVKRLFFILNCIKLPSPVLEFSQNKLKGHWLMF